MIAFFFRLHKNRKYFSILKPNLTFNLHTESFAQFLEENNGGVILDFHEKKIFVFEKNKADIYSDYSLDFFFFLVVTCILNFSFWFCGNFCSSFWRKFTQKIKNLEIQLFGESEFKIKISDFQSWDKITVFVLNQIFYIIMCIYH